MALKEAAMENWLKLVFAITTDCYSSDNMDLNHDEVHFACRVLAWLGLARCLNRDEDEEYEEDEEFTPHFNLDNWLPTRELVRIAELKIAEAQRYVKLAEDVGVNLEDSDGDGVRDDSVTK
jgi:hypothetical protein